MRKNTRSNPGITADALVDRIGTRPLNMVSIDPGDLHVGFVSWDQGVPDHLEEMSPPQLLKVMEKMVQTSWLDLVVIEDWRLYPNKTQEMIGSDFPTCQLIGALKYILEGEGIAYQMQPAQIKYPTMGILKSAGFKLVSKRVGCSNHVQDAELHGWYLQFRGYEQFMREWGTDLRKDAA